MSSTIKKDFYYYLPAYLTAALDSCIETYGNKPWFQEAWEEYRHMARSLNSRHMPMPNKFFGEKDLEFKIEPNDNQVEDNVIQKHYEENFKPTVQEQVRREYQNERYKKFNKKNKKRNY